MKETIAVTFRKRDNYERTLLVTTILFMVIFLLAVTADGSIMFLYLREKFHMSLQTYTWYSSVHNIAWIGGSIFGGYILNKLLHIREPLVIILECFFLIVSFIVMGLTNKQWQLYLCKYYCIMYVLLLN